MSLAFGDTLSVILIIVILIATCVWICCGGGRSNREIEETGKFTRLNNNSPVVNEYLGPLLPHHQDLIGQCDHHPSYQEGPPPYDRAIQESFPYSKCLVTVTEFSSEQKGSPPPEYHSLPVVDLLQT